MIRNDTDYALRMLLHLAESQPHGITARDLSKRLLVPYSFAQKILHKLSLVGIIESKPGQRGGFTLHRKADDTTMIDVINAIQGAPLLNRCTGKTKACVHQSSCRISTSLNRLQDKMNAFLQDTSLADILRDQPDKSSKPSRRRPRK